MRTFKAIFFGLCEENKSFNVQLQIKSKYAKEHLTAYKVGCLEFISEKACFPVPRANSIFLARQSWKEYGEFLRIFQALPGTLGNIYLTCD